jgi:hypothetical protein
MADFNRQLINVSQKTARLKEELLSLFRDYEKLYGESNNLYLSEKVASNNEGLDDFFILLQTLRRNRDIIGSVFKGLHGIRPTERFKFVEEDIAEKKEKEKKEKIKLNKKIKGHIEVPVLPGEIAPANLQDIREPEVVNG